MRDQRSGLRKTNLTLKAKACRHQGCAGLGGGPHGESRSASLVTAAPAASPTSRRSVWLFQFDELFHRKLKGSGLEPYIELEAQIAAEEKSLVERYTL